MIGWLRNWIALLLMAAGVLVYGSDADARLLRSEWLRAAERHAQALSRCDELLRRPASAADVEWGAVLDTAQWGLQADKEIASLRRPMDEFLRDAFATRQLCSPCRGPVTAAKLAQAQAARLRLLARCDQLRPPANAHLGNLLRAEQRAAPSGLVGSALFWFGVLAWVLRRRRRRLDQEKDAGSAERLEGEVRRVR